jgi:ferredoxin
MGESFATQSGGFMKIRVKGDLCCGAGLCAATAPEVFRLDDLGYNGMDGQDVPIGLEELARAGARACPEQAISFPDTDTR